MNGVTSGRPDENHQILFQSNYFNQAGKLFLRGKSIRALDKEVAKVTLDLEKERILVGPPNLVLDQVIKTPSAKVTELYFSLKTNPEYDKNHSSDIFSSVFTDALGKSLNSGRHGILSPSEKPGYDQTLTIALPDNISYQSPITFQLVDYPNRITGEVDIRIK